VHDVISLLHHFKHALYVVSYGDRYLQGETLSRVENCIPCLLHCKKRVIDKLVPMFFLKAQERLTKVSKAAALRRAFAKWKSTLITTQWGALEIRSDILFQLMKGREQFWILQWMEKHHKNYFQNLTIP
jgi:hypothetical protein